jgi:hypothetical protein
MIEAITLDSLYNLTDEALLALFRCLSNMLSADFMRRL